MPAITSRLSAFTPDGIGASPNGSRSLPSSRRAGTKFIAGEPMKPATNRLSGFAYSALGVSTCWITPAAHDRDAVAERHRLGLVVRDVEHRRAQLVLDPRDLRAHLHAQLRVQVRERLVHQERRRIAHDRAAHRDALALAAGQVRGLAVEVVLQLEDLRRLLDLGRDLALADLRQLEREAHVLAHRHVRVQRVVLEDHRDVAVARRELVHPRSRR